MNTHNAVHPFSLKNTFSKASSRVIVILVLLIISAAGVSGWLGYNWYTEKQALVAKNNETLSQKETLESQLSSVSAQLSLLDTEYKTLQAEDQVVKNRNLETEIKDIQTTYQQAVNTYEEIIKLREDGTKVQPLEIKLSTVLSQLSRRNYASASGNLRSLNTEIAGIKAQQVASIPIPANLPTSNAPPASGYSRQVVETGVGTFAIDILSADLGSTRVIVETASAGDCKDSCPVSSLADFVGKGGGFAGINGPYFCPAEYPGCAGKTNSFDTLLMNKNKTYFNSDNNVHSVVPAFIFSGGGARLVGRSSEWGRDTGVDSVIASQPMLLSGGNITFGGDGDPKKGSRGSRSFIATKDNSVYIGVVRGATVAETAHVLKTLGLQSALNLDSGGSTAFYVNGRYVAGPGRNTPFGIVLVRK